MHKKQSKNRSGKGSSVFTVEQLDQKDLAAIKAVVPGTAVLLKELIAPPAVRTRLKYSARYSAVSTAGAVTNAQWYHNSVYNPQISPVSTNKPEGFNEWLAMYDRFRVVSSRIRVAAASTGSFLIVVVPTEAATAFATLADAESAPFAIRKVFSSGGPAVSITKSVSTATLLGLSIQGIMTDNLYSGSIAAAPTDPTYWNIYVQALDATTSTTANVSVEIEYIVDFYDRNNFALSTLPDGSTKLVRKGQLDSVDYYIKTPRLVRKPTV